MMDKLTSLYPNQVIVNSQFRKEIRTAQKELSLQIEEIKMALEKHPFDVDLQEALDLRLKL